MKKILKHFLISIAIVMDVIFINGCYYVFFGQEKSMNKLQQGKELNFYECCSIYSMHTAIWAFGWVISPEAARQQFLMSFPHKDLVVFNNKVVRNCNQTAWEEYTLENIRLSSALNGTYIKNNIRYGYMHWPNLNTPTKINNIPIVYEGLFYYLEQKGWIFPYYFKYI